MKSVKFSLSLCLLALSGFLYAQNDSIAWAYSRTIKAEHLKEYLTVLASDGMQGRETGTFGQKQAAKYISTKFMTFYIPKVLIGKDSTYYQTFPYSTDKAREVRINDSITRYTYMSDYYLRYDTDNTQIKKRHWVFMGYGIKSEKYNDFTKDTLLMGKVVMIMGGEPMRKGKSLITGKLEPSEWFNNYSKKCEQLLPYGPAAVIIVDDLFAQNLNRNIKESNAPSNMMPVTTDKMPFPVIYVSSAMAEKLMKNTGVNLNTLLAKISKKKKPIHIFSKTRISIDIDRTKTEPISENVLAYIEGSDLKDEVIVISAHYDHLGMHQGQIYHGADDDGSGTAALIELAEAFSFAKRSGNGPRRSILIVAMSGEEKGLLGSKYYSEHPVFPLENTVANLNIDMIGRIDSAHFADTNYVYVIGSEMISSQLKKTIERVNTKQTKLSLDYKYDDPKDPNRFYYRSDHYNFAKNGVPVAFFFTGVHADYHKPSDTVDKINFDKVEKISRLVFFTAWDLANRPDRIKPDKN